MSDVFSLSARIALDTSDYEKSLSNASSKTSSFASKLGGGLATAAKVGAVAVSAVGLASSAVSAAMVKGAKDMAEYGDNIDKMSQKMGLSAQAYQEWDAVMQHSGTSMETMKASMKTLANAVESGNKAFEEIGLTQEELSKMSQEEIFEATIAGLQNVENTTQRTYLAGQLLGRGATELGALLNTSAEETQNMRDRVRELGGVMSDEAVKASAKFQDNLQDLNTAISGIKRGIAGEFLPGLNLMMEGFTKLIAGEDDADDAIEKGLESAVDAFSNFISKGIEQITKLLPTLVKVGFNIIKAIAKGISKNSKTLIKSIVEIIDFLAKGLVSALPEFLNIVFSLAKELVSGIVTLLPTLIPNLITAFLEFVEAIIDNIDFFIDAGIELTMALLDGIMNAIPVLIEKIPIIVTKIVTALISNTPKLIDAGVTLLTSLITNLPLIIITIVEKLPEIISSVVEEFTKKDTLNKLIEAGISLFGALVGNIPQILEKIGEKIPEIAQGISEAFKGTYDYFYENGGDIIEEMAQGMRDSKYKWVQALGEVIFGPLESAARFFSGGTPEEIEEYSNRTDKLQQKALKLIEEGYKDEGKDLMKKLNQIYANATSSPYGVSEYLKQMDRFEQQVDQYVAKTKSQAPTAPARAPFAVAERPLPPVVNVYASLRDGQFDEMVVDAVTSNNKKIG